MLGIRAGSLDPMRVVSVNRAMPQSMVVGDSVVMSAIDKRPVEGPVAVNHNGLEGDQVGNRQHHGGPDQAVYVYTTQDYAWWSKELARSLEPGVFGENLTIEGLASAGLAVGDRFHVGAKLVLEVTAPRTPCAKLVARIGEESFGRRFTEAGRPGAYTRVITPGDVTAGDPVRWDRNDERPISILDLVRLNMDPDASEADLERALTAPIAERTRRLYEDRLRRR